MGRIAICVDMDDTMNNFTPEIIKAKEQNPNVVRPHDEVGFLDNLTPLEGAIETVKYLMEQEIFDIFFLTASSVTNTHSHSEKAQWIKRYFGQEALQVLNLCYDKSVFHPIDTSDPQNPQPYDKIYLIDDYDSGRGQEYFRGELLHFGEGRPYPNWETVKKYFDDTYLTPRS